MARFPLAKRRAFLYKVFRRAEVAQLVEQGTENPRVVTSILSLGTIFQARNSVPGFFFFPQGARGNEFPERASPGGTAGTTLPVRSRSNFPPRTPLPPAPAFKASSETRTRPHLCPAAHGKEASPPSRASRLSVRLLRHCLPRGLWRHGCAGRSPLPCAASRAHSFVRELFNLRLFQGPGAPDRSPAPKKISPIFPDSGFSAAPSLRQMPENHEGFSESGRGRPYFHECFPQVQKDSSSKAV